MGRQGRGRYLYLADLIPARHRGIVLPGRGAGCAGIGLPAAGGGAHPLAVPIAWVQYGPESGIILLLAAAMMFWRHKNGLHRIFLGQEKQFFRPKS